MAPEVVEALLKRVPHMEPATIIGYRRYALKGRSYPGMVAFKNFEQPGQLMVDVTDKELAILDNYEGNEYQRLTAQVKYKNSLIDTNVWIWSGSDAVTSNPWDYDHWRSHEMKKFMRSW